MNAAGLAKKARSANWSGVNATNKPFDPAALWGNPGISAQLDYSGKDGASGSDPMTGYLKAVSHNPDFATELFNRGDVADYLLTDRDFYDEDDPFGKGDGTMQSTVNPEHRLSQGESHYLRQDSIGNSAFNGNSTANRKVGDPE
ncbi:hypothetical protein [Streptomyces sp. NPDC091212]|uniref:hypothetical protein n=1 Tax=Streptomyces sp. NPDC091212 TaxID=3155191 RepID=UPI003449407F